MLSSHPVCTVTSLNTFLQVELPHSPKTCTPKSKTRSGSAELWNTSLRNLGGLFLIVVYVLSTLWSNTALLRMHIPVTLSTTSEQKASTLAMVQPFSGLQSSIQFSFWLHLNIQQASPNPSHSIMFPCLKSSTPSFFFPKLSWPPPDAPSLH